METTEHNEKTCNYNKCKHCNGYKKETINRWVYNSKNKDIKHGFKINEDFIDKKFLIKLMINSYDLCYYCSNIIQYKKRDFTMGTIDRLNDFKGHTKNNVVISCLFCNLHKPRVNRRLEYNDINKYYNLYMFIRENF